MRKNGNDGFIVTVDGEERSFTSDDLTEDGYGYSDGNGNAIYSWSENTIEDVTSTGSDQYSSAFHVFVNLGNDREVEAYVVMGTETMPSALANLPTATYDGWAYMTITRETAFDGTRAYVRGDLAMIADFGDGAISGTVTNLSGGDDESNKAIDDYLPGSIALNSANIVGNGYEGTMTLSEELLDGITMAEAGYSGAFFGPEAEQTGGVMWVLFDVDGPAVDRRNGLGMFQADKQD